MATVTVDAALIGRLAVDRGAVSAFPFLAPFGKTAAPGCCGKGAAGPDWRAAADAVARLEPDRLRAFKALVGADRLVLWAVKAARVVKLEL